MTENNNDMLDKIENPTKTLINTARMLRRAAEISQETVAIEMKSTTGTVSNIENNKKQFTNELIARYLTVVKNLTKRNKDV